ncbi:hypothetical protein QQX98_012068 [Neonectria punicea]|uniref:HNH nuclease domain-containing protein n=1 Tax=Neonectria punicea TaxID=979145 RepID=A0ABR1GJU2_9HYPO
MVAEDDGGICEVQRSNDGWVMTSPHLALVEAKRAFSHLLFNEETGDCIPVVSNENLAQYLGEAVITWKANQDTLQDGIFLIAATNTFIRIIYFTFGRDYSDYLDAMDEKPQIELIEDPEKDTFAYMQSTKWINLQSPEGRRNALCHILTLLRWHRPT